MALNIHQSVFSELADFLVERPTLEAMIEHRLPDDLAERVHELLDKNRENNLTRDERDELNLYLAADHFMTLLKAKARLKLEGKE